MRLLVVKTSSLGDVVHTLPAVTDAAQAIPDLRCDWLVERAFAEIPAWHLAVDRVIRCDLRAWRRHPLQTLRSGDWADFRRQLQAEAYDQVIDAQGLVKSAWLARQARGPLTGLDYASAREPLAACFYPRTVGAPKHDAAHAVERARRLFAAALDYPLPDLAAVPDAGLDRAAFPPPHSGTRNDVVLLHGTTWPGKRWPLARWSALAAWLSRRGLRPVLVWGSAEEKADAGTIAAAGNGLVLPRLELTAIAGWLAHARAVVGVDTGLMHLAAALGTPGVSLYGATLPQLTGAVGSSQIWLRTDEGATTIERDRLNAVSLDRVQTALASLLDRPS